MGLFDKFKKNKCLNIIEELLEKGAIKNKSDRLYILENLELWIDDYIKNNILKDFIFKTLYSEAKNKTINKNNIIMINNILKKKINMTIFSNEDNFILIPEFRW